MYVLPPDSRKQRQNFVERYKKDNEQFGNPNQGKESSYAVGNRVYNGFSNSPHSGGGLDKTGYQERDQEASALKQRAVGNMIDKLRKGKNG
jgi:hypothetical protein